MKTPYFKLSDRMTMSKRILTAAACLFSGVLTCWASVTVQGWWHLDNAQPITDSSGNGRTFGSAYSTAYTGGGQVKALLINNGAGGPLDSTGWISSLCVEVGVAPAGGNAQDSMWSIGYNPPAENFGIEMWVFPQSNGVHPLGTAGGNGGWIFSSGQSGGVALRINGTDTNSYIDAFDLGNHTEIGAIAPVDTNNWMEIAIVNAGGITTFYTNGVPCGLSLSNATTASAGDVYAFAAPGDNAAYCGYADEMRMFTFSPGAFTTNDLLLRPAGPNIVGEPQSAVVWTGGMAPFDVITSFESNLLYQWQRGPNDIAGATSNYYRLPSVATTDSGSTFDCIVTASGGLSVTSTPPATLTVVTPNAADVAAYRGVLTNAPGLLAFFPVDNCTNLVVTNVMDASHNGALENNATYDGRTNDSFGQRALSFNFDGDVEVPNNPAYEFNSGFGTIEALVYLSEAPPQEAVIFAECLDGSPFYYALLTDTSGSFLVYANDNLTTSLTWPVPGGLLHRFLDVVLVIDNVTNVTVYVDGESLGTQQQPSFGSTPGGSFWMGGVGNSTTANRWGGTIDELAIYGTDLSAATIAGQYTKFVFGTNFVPPVITSQPSSKTLLAGGSPQLVVTASGALPLSYQWTSNTVDIPGATSSTLVLSNSTTNYSATYSLTVTNVFGRTNTQPIVLTFVAPPAGYAAKIMSDGPVAFWRLAETAGPTAVDSAGLNDAIYSTSGVTYSPGGPSFDKNAGVLFNGSTGRAVTPVNYPDINPSGPFSIEFWANITAYNSGGTTGHFYSPFSSMPRPSRAGGWEWYMGGNSSGYEFHTAEAGGYSLITADNNIPPDGTWWYLTGIWDGTNMYLYVNGELGNNQIDPPAPAGTDNFTAEGQGQTTFVPNTSVPLYIGSRSDGVDYFNGALADIAFYDYALSYEQVTNHWSAAWIPASVVSVSPPGITNVEDSTITLTATVKGLPNTYQWFKGTTALAASALNSDGSAHYPNGVNSSSLEITQPKPTADSGEYFLAITNPIGDTISSNITVLVTPNTNPPTIVSVTGLGTPNTSGTPGGTIPFLVKVVFSARVDYTTGSEIANYKFSPAVTINSLTLLGAGQYDIDAESLGADWREALLVTTGLTPGQKYSLTVSGLKDQSQTPLNIPTTTKYFRAPVLTTNAVSWDYYYLGNSHGGLVSALQADPNYQNYAPQTNSYLTALDTDQITGGDLNNNPTFGVLGDNYGDVTSGWITPTVTGNYTFFLWTDDAGEFDLSSDATAGNASAIAVNPGASSGFLETNSASGGLPPQDSSPQPLTAGKSYYFQLLHAEGGGGDYAKVAWRISTDTTPAAHLTPIPGTYLSAYAPVPAPQFSAPALSHGTLTLPWSGYQGTIQQSTDLVHWTDVPGNPNPLIVDVTSATATFYRVTQ
jgi:hypothetical protein